MTSNSIIIFCSVDAEEGVDHAAIDDGDQLPRVYFLIIICILHNILLRSYIYILVVTACTTIERHYNFEDLLLTSISMVAYMKTIGLSNLLRTILIVSSQGKLKSLLCSDNGLFQ